MNISKLNLFNIEYITLIYTLIYTLTYTCVHINNPDLFTGISGYILSVVAVIVEAVCKACIIDGIVLATPYKDCNKY